MSRRGRASRRRRTTYLPMESRDESRDESRHCSSAEVADGASRIIGSVSSRRRGCCCAACSVCMITCEHELE
jgi:hypothetical protein